MIALLLRFYPARWRVRYGDEFEALLSERPLGPFDVADLLLGALDARLHLRGLGAHFEHRRGIPTSLRVGGYAAIVGSLLWLIGLGVASGAGDQGGMALLGRSLLVVGSAALLVALTTLSAFEARKHPLLTWAAFAIPAVGAVVSTLGVIGMAVKGDGTFIGDLGGWYLWMFGTLAMFAGSGLFVIAAWRARTLSRSAALLGTASVAIVPALMFAFGGLDGPASLLVPVSLVAFVGGWFALGVGALRAGRTATPVVGAAGS